MQKLLNPKGFTLVEFMVAILVFAIAGTLIFEIFSIQYRFFLEQQEFVDMDLKMNAGLRIMVQDIQLSDAGSGVPPVGLVVTTPPLQIELFSDRNGDGATPNAENEDIIYRLDAPTKKLLRNGKTLVDNVNALNFRFFDKGGSELTVAQAQASQQSVTMIKVYMDVESKVKPVTGSTPKVRSLMAGARIFSRQ